jgi:hypothetical protein
VVAINRNAWSQSIGIGGRNHPVRAVSGGSGVRNSGSADSAEGENSPAGLLGALQGRVNAMATGHEHYPQTETWKRLGLRKKR